MAETVNLFGTPVKKGYVIAGGVVVGGAVIYGFYRNRQAQQSAAANSSAASASAPAASPQGDQYPPDGTTGNPSDPYSTDPATGSTYGDEAATGYEGTGVSDLGGYYGSTGLYGAGTGYEQPGEFTSNAYWAQYVEQLMGSSGDDSISQAIGAYISGASVTTDEISIIEQAIAVAGYPPVSGTGGYPPSINSSGSGSSATVAVPDVEGQTLTTAQKTLTGAGLVYAGPRGVAGTETVTSQSPASGTQAAAGSTVTVQGKAAATATAPPKTTTTKATTYGVPKVAGESAATATAHLEADGFKVNSGGLPGNEVVTSTSPAGGTKAAHGTTVTLKGAGKTLPKTTST